MYYEQIADRQYVIRINRGEEVLSSLETFCKHEKIRGACFTGIGAGDDIELAHYSVETQKYSTKSYKQPLEITQLTGNVSYFNDDIVVHAHGTFSDPDMNCIGGHVAKLRISGAMEIFLTETAPLSKLQDSDTGLKLFDLDNQL